MAKHEIKSMREAWYTECDCAKPYDCRECGYPICRDCFDDCLHNSCRQLLANIEAYKNRPRQEPRWKVRVMEIMSDHKWHGTAELLSQVNCCGIRDLSNFIWSKGGVKFANRSFRIPKKGEPPGPGNPYPVDNR